MTRSEEPSAEPVVVEARGLTRRFGALTAVDGVDLTIRRGEVFGFLGPNGAGKSTLFRMILGLLSPSAGSVTLLGHELPGKADRMRSRVGYMAQRFSLYEDLTVLENLEFAAEIFGLDRISRRIRIDEHLEALELAGRRDQRAGTLSGGWKQRLALAVATVHQPKVLLLDEPTAGVDPESRRGFWEEIFAFSAEDTTILVSTHYMDEAVRCHRLCMMMEGRRVAVGPPTDLEAALAGRVVEVRAEPLEGALVALRARPEVASVTQLGDWLHLLLAPELDDAEAAASTLVSVLEAGGLHGASFRTTEPSLEDVFVALTLGERLERAHA
ncbi:MAG: ABC transporter ATP-binding protein [Thermoanaerobaculia bacterium]